MTSGPTATSAEITTGETLTLEVERLAYGPDAVAHTGDGKAVFVSGAVPGDVVEAELTQTGRSFSKARTTKVLDPSVHRVRPACPLAGMCGGCPWAIADRDYQLEAKRANVVDSLTRIGHFAPAEAERLVAPCETPSPAWGYRNKVELAFQRHGKRTTVGMHDVTGTNVVKVSSCPLLDRKHAKLVKSVSGAVTYLSNSHGLEFERLGIRASSRTGDVQVALWTKPGPFPRAQAAKIIADSGGSKVTSLVRVMTKGPAKARKIAGVEVLSGRSQWHECLADEDMLLSAPSFFQVNTAGAERLQELVLEGLDPRPQDEAMDLYSGAGTFTLPLARRCAWVSAVESYGPAVRDLRLNLEHAGIDNADPIGGDAGREFPDTDADVIVVDPPRAGLAEDVVRKLSDQPARRIAYVSCDPATLARDLARFRKLGIFEPLSVTPVDLFPQTFHVETVCMLQKCS